ncbi:MAG TPA: enolase C-terminal domain-like protein [Candidatus Acidoferrales bacterium]|jgi:mannonate dehydratase|nr:enolase C-terminal domain-like protein [Candidatus Acidoferrales bacterium]
MNRRDALGIFAGGAGLAAFAMAANPVRAARESAKGLPPLKITDVQVILTQLESSTHYVIVKVMTSEPGLYGLGCATHAERPLVVATAIEQYLKPMVVGRNVDDIEDIWQTANVAPYWRNGVDANNALSGVDAALWDIMGKRAGLPVYAFFGGKVRKAIPLYATIDTLEPSEIEQQVRQKMAEGYRHVKVGLQSGATAAQNTQGQGKGSGLSLTSFDPEPYVNSTIKIFDYLRSKIGFEVELIHTVHGRVPPSLGLALAKQLEPYRPFFVEDLFSPEDVGWYQYVREETSTALATGQLFVNPNEWIPVVSNRWVDVLRIHVSAVGGINMVRKLAAFCEFFNVRTSWHGPGFVSPVGVAMNMHLDFPFMNFGIHEEHIFSSQVLDIFPGTPEIKGGLMYSNDLPGLGIDIDEKAAAKHPYTTPGFNRGGRYWDGTPMRP